MKGTMTLRACAVQSCAALLAAMASGCFSISLTHELEDVTENGPPGGKYNIKGVDATLAAALRKHAPGSIVFTDESDSSVVPLDVHVSDVLEDKDTTSAVHVVPGALTFLLFPGFGERQKTYKINCISPIGAKEIGVKMVGRETVCWTPLGWLPFAFPLDGYDYTCLDVAHTWSENKKQAWEDATMSAEAKAIISTLTKARYDAFVTEQKNADEANHRENVMRMAERGWPLESTLRDFAVKEATGLWDIIVSFRAEISIRKNRLRKLSEAIKGFGRKPEDDADCISCKGEYDAARSALVQIFKSLENAYLAASKNDALYESAEAHARTRKAIDECSRVAIDAADRILNKNNPETQKQRRQR